MGTTESVIQLVVVGPMAVAAVAWAAVIRRRSLQSARRVFHDHSGADGRRRRHRAVSRR